ncbi:hypothetical protein CSA56_08395 [candidate division KSB3 bacterium]|uniref:Uncharacterized protein n=1 Tax=candidate division KSB3 bacterium TaxID=2044937 RepID=A0A2G6KEP2_9BACT|nr:MAG: hypothetical protein CSA56_08395 [candidate division KSB3 bacterium]
MIALLMRMMFIAVYLRSGETHLLILERAVCAAFRVWLTSSESDSETKAAAISSKTVRDGDKQRRRSL